MKRLLFYLFSFPAILAFAESRMSLHEPEPAGFDPLSSWIQLATAANVTDVGYGGGSYVAGTDFGSVLIFDEGSGWEHALMKAPSSMNGMIFAGERWVAVGARGQIHTSADARSWTTQWSGTEGHLRGITYGRNQYVAVGGLSAGGRVILTSSNAVHWTTRELARDQAALWNVIFEQDRFVAVGNFGTIVTSADARTWSAVTNLTRARISGIAYGNGQFIAVGDAGIFGSTNGVTWTTNRLLTTGLFDVAYGAGRFAATGDDNRVWTSRDGLNWEFRETGSRAPLGVITYAGDRFLAGGQEGTVAISADGLQWEVHASGATKIFRQVASGHGRMAAIGESSVRTGPRSFGMTTPLIISEDGREWDTPFAPQQYGFHSLSFASDRFIGFGLVNANPTQLVVANSHDGINWDVSPVKLRSTPEKVVYGNGNYVGAGAHLFASPDGTNWSTTGTPTYAPLFGIAFGNDRFVAARYARVYTSSNGQTWSTNELPELDLLDIAFGNGTFAGIGFERYGGPNVAGISRDGITWTPQTIPADALNLESSRAYFDKIIFGGGRFVAFGNSKRIISSQDGVTWTPHEPGALAPLNAMSYENGRFIAVGSEGVVLESSSLWPELAISKETPNQIRLMLRGLSGQVFAIQSTSSLPSPAWNELGRITNSVSGSVFFDARGSQRFYRIQEITP